MNWHLSWFCVRPGCDQSPTHIRLMKHTNYNFIYPMALCDDCVKFLQLKDSRIGVNA